MFKLIRLLLAFLMPSIDGGDGGGAPAAPSAPAAPASAPVSAPAAPAVATPAVPAAPAVAPTMLDAITKHFERDELGRFATNRDGTPVVAKPTTAPAPIQGVATPAVPAVVDPAKQPAEDDILAMPEGLGEKGQARWSKLTGVNRELTQRVDTLDRQVGYVRETFQQHGIRQEQFEQAAQFMGAVNKGDFATAERLLLGQLQQLSLATGKTYGGAVDALSAFPDLRQKVDGLQMTEADAMEVARLRSNQHATQQRQQVERQQQEATQASTQAFQQAQNAVDLFCKDMAAKDIDYPAVEAQLLPVIPQILQDVPPAAWPRIVKAQYELIKQTAMRFRTPSVVDTNPLRATGAASLQQKPNSMFEAMWGKSA